MKNEPAITIGSVTALVAAVVLLLDEFGVPLTEGQQNAIVGLVAVAAPIVAAVLIRRKVTPVASDDERGILGKAGRG